MRRLNIFVDETGEFGFGKGSSELYGISFTFHEHKDDIKQEIKKLNERLNKIGYDEMIHMADLVLKRNDYRNFDINTRKSIFNSIYQFSRRIPVKYKTIIINKKYTDNIRVLKKRLKVEIEEMIDTNINYFKRFSKIVLYYDNGQEVLGKIFESTFGKIKGFEHRIDFDHKEKRLFQVSDMLTFVDKYEYKHNNKIPFTNGEKYFFSNDEGRRIIKELSKKRL